MKIFYMNQGGPAGEFGTPNYKECDIVLLAESQIVKPNFKEIDDIPQADPAMSIQTKIDASRIISKVTDLIPTAKTTRPILTFTTTGHAGCNIRVVFVHLKSGNEKKATDELDQAIEAVIKKGDNLPILWIGDFNRAEREILEKRGATALIEDGGQAEWKLDRAYKDGNWDKYEVTVKKVTKAALDHGHVGFVVTITAKEE